MAAPPPQPQIQYVQVPAPAAPAGPSVFGRMTNACQQNSGMAVALIIVLLVVVVYLFAVAKDWVSSPFSGKEKLSSASRKKSKRAAPSAAEAEIDDLIADIEA